MIEPERVRVGLGERAYEVIIGGGLIDRAGVFLSPHLPRRRTAVVTDETVAAQHGQRLRIALESRGIAVDLIAIPPGEGSKSFAGLESLCDRLLGLGLDRGDVITAFGGGVVGDLAGFAAAIYKRGVDFLQIPTTLLAQVDSSVGGKTAIDTPRGKNLIGSFHQPRAVFADLEVLASLPARQIRAGFGEVLKYGLLGDAEFFAWLEENTSAVLALEAAPLAHAVKRSVQMKASIVAEDEREVGRRALLNLGHTFAHALESETGYDDSLLHGEAVAIGCALAFRFSALSGDCPAADATRVETALRRAGLPSRLSELAGSPFGASRLLEHMRQDKKVQHGALSLVLARRIGDAFVARAVDASRLQGFLVGEGARSDGVEPGSLPEPATAPSEGVQAQGLSG